jgi:hypothetical protein
MVLVDSYTVKSLYSRKILIFILMSSSVDSYTVKSLYSRKILILHFNVVFICKT